MGTSVIFARGLLAEVHRRELDPELVLRACQIDGTRLRDLREMLSVEEVDMLTRTAMHMTSEPALGLIMGARAPHTMLQVFGQLLLVQPTLREAFGLLPRYSALVGDGFAWTLSETNELAVVTCEPDIQLGDSTRFAVDYSLAVARRIGSHFLPRGASLERVQFRHARPSYWQRYERIFECTVEFDQARNAVTFQRSHLDRVQPHADALVDQALRQIADDLLRERGRSRGVAQRLDTLLRYEDNPENLRPDGVARQFGMSVRGLRRSLTSEGISLARMIGSARCRIACELLQDNCSVEATARQLGFSDRSAFHRAFRRWTGRTPREFVRHTQRTWDSRVS